MESLFKVSDLNVTFTTAFGNLHAVRDVNLYVNSSEIIGIVGESGSGKSQTFLSALRLSEENAQVTGTVLLENQDLLQLSSTQARQIRHKKIGIIFQDPMTSLNPYMKVGRQLLEPLIGTPLTSSEKIKKVSEWLEKVQISDPLKRLKMYPHEFSGGLRQRLMIVMALIHDPVLLIADEPTTALDVTTQLEVLSIIRDLQKSIHTSIVFVSHDMGVISNMADRVYVMYGGKVVEEGKKDEILENPLHPYTRGLIKSARDVENYETTSSLYAIPGTPPNLINIHDWCPLYARCVFRQDRCKKSFPKKEVISDSHSRYCYASQDEVKKLEL